MSEVQGEICRAGFESQFVFAADRCLRADDRRLFSARSTAGGRRRSVFGRSRADRFRAGRGRNGTRESLQSRADPTGRASGDDGGLY
jgi:hypothetical protein